MDTEQQIRLNFLDEAAEYLDSMESGLLGLADTLVDAQKADLVLRSAHSIKGGAAMMGFNILSGVAHRLEDFLKILRVRYVAKQIDREIEVLFLQSIDCLKDISQLHRQGMEVTASDIDDRTNPIFEQLHQHLGELEVADENALLAQDEDIDPAVLIFEEGVEGVLDRFEAQLQQLKTGELTNELSTTAQELIGFGMMASLDSFIQLCESIQQQVARITPTQITPLAEEALKTWRRSHALVLRGSIEKLPSHLEGFTLVEPENTFDNLELATLELLNNNLAEGEFDPLEADSLDLSSLQSVFGLSAPEILAEEEFDPLEADSLDLGSLQSAFEINTPEILEDTPATIPSQTKDSQTSNFSLPNQAPSDEQREKMVRVPASQLKQFNTLFEQLILNRNSINLRLEQLQNIVSLMSQRMSQMEHSNTQLKQWYGRASIEGLLSNKEQLASVSANPLTKKQERFDSLEMDRYTDIHLICQDQIETIVQLQEVAIDIELGVQEVNQSVRDLHYTTKSMQGNVTRTQMLPFADAVKRCPRILRDLNLQFGKQVNLKVSGERNLLDRSVIEALGDPLMHLLRNSFDHGIEDSEIRLAAGKAEFGTITIAAKNLGTYSVITLSDDGGGISLTKIRDRLCQMGFTQVEAAQIPEAEILDFIFEPGFSTAQKVTELSGRGVGMDVVRTNLQEVRGDVRVDTRLGKGTTFTLKIPFSLSILRVAILEQGGIVFAIPANNIQALVASAPEAILSPNSDRKIIWNQIEIPLIEIEKTLVYHRPPNVVNLTGEPSINQTMTLVVGDDKSFAALKISHFWDELESTTRSVESLIPLPDGFISSVVFGDGKVIPLIDPMALVQASLSDRLNSDPSGLSNFTPLENNILTTKTILIVDDSINVRRLLSMTLEKAGYQVEQAKDGREAVNKLIGGLAVQAVICDVEMPKLDGYGVLEEIKERAEFSALPIAMLTSRSNEKHRRLAMNLGASAYFSKPYDEKQLLSELKAMTS